MRSLHDARKQTVGAIRQRLTLHLFARGALLSLAAAGLAWGLTVLVLRMALDAPRGELIRTLWLPLAAAGIGGLLALRRLPSREKLAAAADGHAHFGGLLLAADRPGADRWAVDRPASAEPEVTWRPRAVLLPPAVALLFAALALWMPIIHPTQAIHRPFELDQQFGKTAEQIETLEQEELIEAPEAETLREQLEQIWQDARGDSPIATLEALDHLQEMLQHTSDQALEEMLSQMLDAATMEAVSRTLAEALSDPGALESLAGALELFSSEMLETLSEAIEGMQIPEALKEALKNAPSLSPEQLKQLCEALKNCQNGNNACLSRLCEAGLIDPEALQAGMAALGEQGQEALAAFLSEHEGDELGACLSCFMPGTGGITRGRGDAPLTFKDPSSADGATFTPEMVPPGALASLDDARLKGISMSAPEPSDPDAPTAAGALDGARAGGGTARRYPIQPRHRQAVESYFQRTE